MRKVLCSERFCLLIMTEAVAQRCSVKKGVLRDFTKFTWKHLCQNPSFQRLKLATLLKKRLWQMFFPVNFCEIAKNTFLFRTPPVAASVMTFIFEAAVTLPSLITNSFRVVYLLSKMRSSITVGFFFLSLNFFSSRYKICWFYVFTFFREVLKF